MTGGLTKAPQGRKIKEKPLSNLIVKSKGKNNDLWICESEYKRPGQGR